MSSGAADDEDLHGSRLHMLLERTIDTTVRGVVYEAGRGRELVERMTSYNEIPVRILEHGAPDWDSSARTAIRELLAR
jgi:hypothetical protein